MFLGTLSERSVDTRPTLTVQDRASHNMVTLTGSTGPQKRKERMMKKNLMRVGAVAAIAFAAVGGLTACSTPAPAPSESAVGSDIVSPIQIPVAEANGNTYDIPMNSTGYLNVATGTEAEWSATFSMAGVVEFTEGGTDGGSTMVPGLTPVAEGTTEVTLTNSATSESVTFTVNVTM